MKFVVLFQTVLMFGIATALYAENALTVKVSEIRNRECSSRYSLEPAIVKAALSCGGGAAEDFEKSFCVGIVECTGIKSISGTDYNVRYREAVVCKPVKGSTDRLEDAHCPSARDCLADKRVTGFSPKTILPEGFAAVDRPSVEPIRSEIGH